MAYYDTLLLEAIQGINKSLEIIANVIEKQDKPTTKAEVVRSGIWKFDSFTAKYGNPYRCSECREEYGDTHNFCPNCGAKMDGE